MPLPPAVSERATEQLPRTEPPASPAPEAAALPKRGRIRARLGAAARRFVQSELAPLHQHLATVQAELVIARRDIAQMRDELLWANKKVTALELRTDAVEELTRHSAAYEVTGEQLSNYGHITEVLTVNQELMKSEVRSVVDTIDALGAAIAPGAGLEGAGPRLAELRERVYSLERRIRGMLTETPANPPPAVTATAPPLGAQPTSAPATQAVASDLFDYVGFEQRFRGDQRAVLDALAERYLDLLKSSPPVLDIGCGRGELIGLLGEHGVEAYGVDTDASMVAEARADGLDVRREDAIAHLENLEPGSLGAIISTHVVEHLELGDLLRLIELSTSRLRPGGIFIAETPNPSSLIVLGNSYILDPTHVRPLHPSLMSFLCESAGFRDVRLQFFAPAEGYWLDLVEARGTPAWVDQVNNALRKLNDVLFGPQEYAIIARTVPHATEA